MTTTNPISSYYYDNQHYCSEQNQNSYPMQGEVEHHDVLDADLLVAILVRGE